MVELSELYIPPYFVIAEIVPALVKVVMTPPVLYKPKYPPDEISAPD